MKYVSGLLLLLVLSSFTGSVNYPVAKLYAYRQKITSGVNSTFDKKDKTVYRNYIYLLVKQNRQIEVEQVWINGEAVQFKTGEITSPVIIDAGVSLSGKSATETLVPKTEHKVLELITDKNASPDGKMFPRGYRSYQLLIQYKEDGKTFFLGSRFWKTIASSAKQ
ncbi:hypothetical protein ESA94_13870 [Lacibacter luteus]|uniref:Uncharacterized protein n=1 Tax=Lacibacter luteus TaxID=2508719 RepID=A0A4V1M7C1_9BACT|nr:hypothetical protein [Lacibacter luteus]RXK59224.1 hypothetical protein ESA94_13870 [Lacibacter luteus]